MKDHFKFGETVDISQLHPEQAIAFFGEPLYSAWFDGFKAAPWCSQRIALRVKSVNRNTRTIEIEIDT